MDRLKSSLIALRKRSRRIEPAQPSLFHGDGVDRPQFAGFRVEFIDAVEGQNFVRHGQLIPTIPMSLAPRNTERKLRIDVERQIHPIHIERSKAALCIAGEAVCLMGAPKTPTIVVEPLMCMKIKPRQVW